MKIQSTLWEFRKDIPNYDSFTVNEQLFNTALVCLGYYPYIVLLSNGSEIQIHHIENIYKSISKNHTQYNIEYMRFSPKGGVIPCECEIMCICSKTNQ